MNWLTKEQIERKRVEERYWKLKPMERLHYDSRLKELKKNSDFSLFKLFRIYFSLFLFIFIVVFGMIYFYGNGIITFKEVGEELFREMLSNLAWVIVFYFVFFIFLEILYEKNKKKLNKRFKLLGDKN